MRRLLALAVALLGVAVPAANAASTVATSAVTVTPTQAVIKATWFVESFTADVSFDYGPTTTYGATKSVETATSSGGPRLLTITGLAPGTTYHLQGRINGEDAVHAPLVTLGADTTFTTPPLGTTVVARQTDSLLDAAAAPAVPSHGATSLHSCSDSAPPPPADGVVLSRFRGYAGTNPDATPSCVTVQVSSSCPDLRIIAYKSATDLTEANVVAGDATAGPDHELQFVVANGASFAVGVGDNAVDDASGCNADYSIAISAASLTAPIANTAKPVAIGVRSVTLQGSASSRLVHGVTTKFQWGATTGYGKELAVPGTLAVDNLVRPLSRRLTGLLPNTVYHARLVTTGPSGTVFGTDTTFRTLKKQVPLKLQATSIGVKPNSIASVKITCPLTTVTCSGTVVLRGVTGKRAKLGTKTFKINGGKSATVSVKLSSTNRKLVKRLKTLKVTATLTGKDGDKVVFAAAKPRAKLVWRG